MYRAYDSTKYDSLNVSPEIKNLFSFITFYTPQMIEINTKLKPFIPDYIPAVGDVDAFIKVIFYHSSNLNIKKLIMTLGTITWQSINRKQFGLYRFR